MNPQTDPSGDSEYLVSQCSSAPLAGRIVAKFGPPRALVNNAGVCLYADITETTDEMWETSLNTNLVGASALIRGFVPGMKGVEGAAIVTGQGIVADGGQMSGQNYVKVFGKRESFRARQEPET